MDFDVVPIAPGYEAHIPITYPNDYVDEKGMMDGELLAQFRESISSEVFLFQASTVDGTITRERGASETLVTIIIPASATQDMPPDKSVTFDIVRVEASARDLIPGVWRWPVRRAVTRDVS